MNDKLFLKSQKKLGRDLEENDKNPGRACTSLFFNIIWFPMFGGLGLVCYQNCLKTFLGLNG